MAKTRTKKTSQGIHGGGGKVRLTEIEKVLLGGGMLRNIKVLTGDKR